MYDVIIVGGGLAGLVSAIELSPKFNVLLIEKEEYPFHKVCGEYISNESRSLLESYGLPFDEWKLPEIDQLSISDVQGKQLHSQLEMGGFGISRYKLDEFLAMKAKQNNAEIHQKERVEGVSYNNDIFTVTTNLGSYQSKLVIGAYGKREKLDKSLGRDFIKKRTPYLAVKYHVKNASVVDNGISLHNFEGGYLGCSRVEDGTVCICYLSWNQHLKKYAGISEMEENILFKNPEIKKLFAESTFLYEEPLVISQISFAPKERIKNHVLMIGDSAGLITPLCGNGMSMAMHSAFLLSKQIEKFLKRKMSREHLENQYQLIWNKEFRSRLLVGRSIQSAFGAPWKTNVFLSLLKPFPGIRSWLISKTHGKDFYKILS